jgi:hypothetical protein
MSNHRGTLLPLCPIYWNRPPTLVARAGKDRLGRILDGNSLRLTNWGTVTPSIQPYLQQPTADAGGSSR